MLSRPLVTGAGGFIGSHLAQHLASLPEVEFVYVVDIPTNVRLQMFSNNPKIKILTLDLCAPNVEELLPNDASIVFALAALNGTGRFYAQPHTVLINSTIPTLTILNKYAKLAPIVYSSSSEVYASTISLLNWNVPTDESVPIAIENVHNPRWSYATAKLYGEVALISAAQEVGATGTIVRYHNVYGPDMGVDHFVPDFISRCQKGSIQLYGSEQTRAFMYIDDAVAGTILAARNSTNLIPIFHLGSNEELSILEAARIMLKQMGLQTREIELFEAPEGSVPRRCADPIKAKNVLGWSASITFAEGIRRILEAK
jgi:nucleoside-diphosphate-sugar epimerase